MKVHQSLVYIYRKLPVKVATRGLLGQSNSGIKHCLFYKINGIIVISKSTDQPDLLPSWKIWANWCGAKYSIVTAVDN